MAWLAAGTAASVVGNILGNNAQKKAAKQAAATVKEGRDYAINQSGLTDYAKAGIGANDRTSALLGLGGDKQAADAAFDNYLNSTGYRFQLDQGNKAVTGAAGAKGLLKSGATLKALQKQGQNTGATYFNNYLGQVGNVANRGLQASDSLARTVTNTAGQTAGIQNNSGAATADAYNNIGSTIGGVAGYIGGRGGIGEGGIANIWGS